METSQPDFSLPDPASYSFLEVLISWMNLHPKHTVPALATGGPSPWPPSYCLSSLAVGCDPMTKFLPLDVNKVMSETSVVFVKI